MMKKFSRCGVLALLVFAALGMVPVTAQGEMSANDAFCILCQIGTAENVLKALTAGAHANARDEAGWTALIAAAQDNSDPEVVKVLLKRGADARAGDNNLRGAHHRTVGKNSRV